jgi:tetratricopeptide (TPR) repeat protein
MYDPSSFTNNENNDMKMIKHQIKQLTLMEEKARVFARPSRTNHDIILEYKFMKMNKLKQEEEIQNNQTPYQNTVDLSVFRKHSSYNKKLNELEPITLKDMKVNQIHYGKYLMCKTVEMPYSEISIVVTLVQDKNNSLEFLKLHNFRNSLDIEASELLPPFTGLIIKEPYLKSIHNDAQALHIRVDSPTDLIFLTDESYEGSKTLDSSSIKNLVQKPEPKFDESFQEGVKFLDDKKYYSAIRSLTEALNSTSNVSNIKQTMIKRSASNLKLEKFNNSYQDATNSLKIEDAFEGNLLAGKSLYQMRQFGQALEHFNKALDIDPQSIEAKVEMLKTRQRLHEANTGSYNFEKIIDWSKKQGVLRLDLADFKSCDIEVVELAPNCKGVVAKTDLKRNTLICASKASSIAYLKEFNSNKSKSRMYAYNFHDKNLMSASQTLNLTHLVHRVQNDPYLSRELYKSYCGPELNREEKIDDCMVDINRLEAIQKYNAFDEMSDELHIVENESVQIDIDPASTGIWLYPSYFNHECISNLERFTFADLMLIYTSNFYQLIPFLIYDEILSTLKSFCELLYGR